MISWRKWSAAAFVALMVWLPLSAAMAIYPFPNRLYVKPTTGGGCSQATAFLARTSGLSGTQSGAYTTMICGMVSDGTWSLLDALWVFATNTTTTANLNLVSTSYPITAVSSPTFTANAGYTGNGTSSYLSEPTALNSFTNYQQNSAIVGVCDLTSRTTSATTYLIGASNGTTASEFLPLYSSAPNYEINSIALLSGTASNAQGSWFYYRSGSTSTGLYLNGASNGTNTSTSVSVPNLSMYFLARNASGTAGGFSTDEIGYAFVGAGMTSTQATAMYNRLHTFLTTVGAPSGC